jgi:Cysteine-rich secretory protein family
LLDNSSGEGISMARSIASIRTTVIAVAVGAACFAATPSAAAPNSFAAQFPGRVLAVHNAVRASAGLAPMAWDPALGASAAAYATRLAFSNRFEHSTSSARRGAGENLWMGTRGAFAVERMVSDWASERRMFVPGVFPAVTRTANWADVGHYTQIIWPTTTRVGCALATNARADYLVCHYSPAGNVGGRPVGIPARSVRVAAR